MMQAHVFEISVSETFGSCTVSFSTPSPHGRASAPALDSEIGLTIANIGQTLPFRFAAAASASGQVYIA